MNGRNIKNVFFFIEWEEETYKKLYAISLTIDRLIDILL